MPHPHLLRYCAAFVFALALCSSSWAQTAPGPDDNSNGVFWFRAPLPLGADAFLLRPAGREFYVMSCIEDRRFDRLQVSRVRNSPFVIDAAGDVWEHYPADLTFRVTATAMDPGSVKTDIDNIDEQGDMNSFLLGLRFRLKVFRGLQMQIVNPSAVHLIGMPSDVPYDERVYRVKFNAADFPVDARLVMEVLSPAGKLLSRFHLELL